MSVSRLLLFVRSVIDLASKVFLIVGSKKVQSSTPPQKIGRLTQFNNPLQLTVSSLLSLVLQILIASANHADYRPVGRKNRFMPLWKEMYDFKVGPQSYNLQSIEPFYGSNANDVNLDFLFVFKLLIFIWLVFHSRRHATVHLAETVGPSVGPSVTFFDSERFSPYCSCPTISDWIAVYPALFTNTPLKRDSSTSHLDK